jgi:hypothetical protein
VFPGATNPVERGGASCILNWAVVSLPYLEGAAEYHDFLDQFTQGNALAGEYFGTSGMCALTQQVIPVFVCPSASKKTTSIVRKTNWDAEQFGALHYEATAAIVEDGDDKGATTRNAGSGAKGFYWGGIMTRMGASPTGTGGPNGKMFISMEGNTIESVKDGLSKTFLIGESVPPFDAKRTDLDGVAEPLSNNAFGWFQYETAWAGYSGGLLSRFKINEAPSSGNVSFGRGGILENVTTVPYDYGYYQDIRSPHPKSAGVALGDGSVRNVANTLDLDVKHILFNRNSGSASFVKF